MDASERGDGQPDKYPREREARRGRRRHEPNQHPNPSAHSGPGPIRASPTSDAAATKGRRGAGSTPAQPCVSPGEEKVGAKARAGCPAPAGSRATAAAGTGGCGGATRRRRRRAAAPCLR
jgi:hypothetical protein